ncbi:MAG: hypothetical protein HY913_18570 [Desulfomonile tiedjei]|nr:hypothetical protein [Desulfomonile tiedjei]
MSSRHVFAVCGVLCLLISVHVSDAVGQTIGFPGIPAFGASLAAGSPGQKDQWSAASLHAGWMTAPGRIHAGYDGLVPPGACVSSFFVYPLSGVEVGGSLPIRLTDRCALRVYGSYLIPYNPQADQEITWTIFPPGVREWRRSNSEMYKIGGEALYRMSGEMALVGGFRLQSLLTNFSDPNPDYLFTVPWMEAQTTVAIYEPYVGIRLELNSTPGALNFRLVGFPVLFATIQHFNTCNNNGIPFAHTGRQNATRGYFVEASAEYRLGLFQGVQAAGFVDWNAYHGHCPMTIERHEGGPNPSVTSATVAWSHHISSLVVGARIDFSWNLPL